ncbi:MAG: ABC transporter permease [Bdellovibrionales bacterium]|jgi:ABC-2 type transport system permease protein
MRVLRRKMMEEQEEQDVLLRMDDACKGVRVLGAFNGRGLWTLTVKEIARFMKIWPQTILAPLVMTFLFYAVFAVGMGGNARMIDGVPFLTFAIPGLIMMAMAQSAFMTPSSSMIISKLQGNIVDILMPPLSALELTLAYTISGVVRGLLVGGLGLGAFMALPAVMPHHIGAVIFFAVAGSLMLSLMGLLTGILGDKFDHLGAAQSFFITPATFLSGTFFSASQLPPAWRGVLYLNPFFYMIDGFRYGFTGSSEAMLLASGGMLAIISLVLFTLAYWLFAHGTRLKT